MKKQEEPAQTQRETESNMIKILPLETHKPIVPSLEQKKKKDKIEKQPLWRRWLLRAVSLLSIILNVIVGYLANSKNKQIAKQFFIYVTPRSPFFMIWPFVYALLFGIAVYNLKENAWKKKSHYWFITSNSLMILWSLVWTARNIASVTTTCIILIPVVIVTLKFWESLRLKQPKTDAQKYKESESSKGPSVQDELNSGISLKMVPKRGGINENKSVKKQFQKTFSEAQIEQDHKIQKSVKNLIQRNIIALYIGWLLVTFSVNFGLVQVYLFLWSKCTQFVLFGVFSPLAISGVYLVMSFRQKDGYIFAIGLWLSVTWGVIGAAISSIDFITSTGQC